MNLPMRHDKQIAIILPDTLRSTGLQSLLADYFPPVEICHFPSFELFANASGDAFDYFFTDPETFVLNADFFLPSWEELAFMAARPLYDERAAAIAAGERLSLKRDIEPLADAVMALGCIKMRLTPEEAFNACTINTAYAMGVSRLSGSITAGKRADLIITKPLPSFAYIPYCHHTPYISKIIVRSREA